MTRRSKNSSSSLGRGSAVRSSPMKQCASSSRYALEGKKRVRKVSRPAR